MTHPARPSILAALVASLALPAVSFAQAPVPSIPAARPERDSRPPIPPGVPSTADNVHLPTEGEIRLGREGATEVEKVYKVVTSGAHYDRLQRVSREVVSAIQRSDIIAEYRRVYKLPRREDKARRVPFEYTFKVLDTTKEVNAFSLSGGPVYVTRGLLDYATSDDELAAVLAHECAHVAYHHVEQLVRKQKKVQSKQIWGLIATVIAGAAGGGAAMSAAGNLMMGAQLVSIATLTGYGRELEHEADRIGVHALSGTRYHPLAMLTFMQKLARDDRLRGNPDFGIFQSHPYSNERVVAIRKEVETLGYAADTGTQRLVSGTFRVEMVEGRVNGKPAAELRLNSKPLFTVVASEGGLSAVERGEKLARQLETLFRQNVGFNDVKQSADRDAVLLKGIPVIRVYPEDAAVLGSSAAVTERAYNEIMRALWKEKLETQF
jgi:beta-barrel assembly-enhancing protease